MSKKKNIIGGLLALAVVAAIGFAGYRVNISKNEATADGNHAEQHAMPIGFSDNKQLIIGAGTRLDSDNSALTGSLVLGDFFTKDNKQVTRYTEWGVTATDLPHKTTETQMNGLDMGEGEYVEISSDNIPAKEMQTGTRHFYRTVLKMDGKTYFGPITSFMTQKQ